MDPLSKAFFEDMDAKQNVICHNNWYKHNRPGFPPFWVPITHLAVSKYNPKDYPTELILSKIEKVST